MDTLQLPKIIPLMPLPGVVLMPHAMLPLFIFEERYREMVADCLQADRVYMVPQMKPGVQEVTGIADIFPIAGVGLIRACVENPDGTSNLILQGLARVRIRKLHEDRAYRTGEIEPLPSKPEIEGISIRNFEALKGLCIKVQNAGHPLPPLLEKHLNDEDADPGDLADLACSAFVKDPLHLQELLEEPVVEKRIGKLLKFLR